MKKQIILLTVGIAAVIVLLWWSDFKKVYAVLIGIDASVLFFLCLIQICKVLLLCLQWKLIVSATGYNIGFFPMLHITVSGKFVESVTPGFKVGGEITKTVMLKDMTPMSMAEAIAVTVAQKALNILAFVIICLVSLTAFFLNTSILINPSLKTTLLASMGGLVAISLALLVFIANPQWAGKMFRKSGLEEFRDKVSVMYRRPLWLLGQLLLTMVIWSTYAITAIVAARSMEVNIQSLYVVLATFLSYMFGMIPLLPGGLGAAEAGLAGFVTLFGASRSKAMALTLVLRFVVYWFLLLASSVWFFGSKIIRIIMIQRDKKDITNNI